MHMTTKSALIIPFSKIAMVMVAMLMAFWLAACSVTPSSMPVVEPEQTSSTVANNKSDPLSYRDCVYPPAEMVQACTKKGGAFSQQGMLGCYQCVLSYPDAGKTCQDSKDCQGKCKNTGEFIENGTKNQSGQCASDSSGFGCYQAIEKGVAQPAICVD